MKLVRSITSAALATLLLAMVDFSAFASTTIYINPASGNWEVSSNWLGGAPATGDDVVITNLPGKTVTIGGTAPTNTLSVNSVTIGSGSTSGMANTLTLNTSQISPLEIAGNLSLLEGGALDVNSSNGLQVLGTSIIAAMGPVSSTVSNTTMTINGPGMVNFSGDLVVGQTNYSAMLNIFGGTALVSGQLRVADAPSSSGAVTMTAGSLIDTNGPVIIGNLGSASFLQTGGAVTVNDLQLGNASGSQGTYTLSGGVLNCLSSLQLGTNFTSAVGSFILNSNSVLIVTNASQTAFVSLTTNGTLALNGGMMQVDNLVFPNGGSFTNLGGTINFTKPLKVDNGGSITISGNNAVLGTSQNVLLGTSLGSTGSLSVLNGGALYITNAALDIGNAGTLTNSAGTGFVTISNATVTAGSVNLGSTAGGIGYLTLLTNGVFDVQSNLTLVSSSLTATSSMTLAGGSLIMSNGLVRVGPEGSGRLTVSGGNHVFQQVWLGNSNNLGSGIFRMTGGKVTILGAGSGPGKGFVSNYAVFTGGEIDGSGTSLTVGLGHDSDVYLGNNVTAEWQDIYVGYSPGFTGTYTQTNGVMAISDSLVIGTDDCVAGAVGEVTMLGGTMYVTNATHTAVLDVLNGIFILNAGATLVVDNLVVTNSCGHFQNFGGRLVQNNPPNLSPDLDADDDGMSNTNEILAGTDPLSPGSLFRVTNIALTNETNVRIDWTTVPGRSYVVQTNGSLSDGTFRDLSPVIMVPVANTTNYLHVNGATNGTQFYRVRLGP